ncbi:phosphopentomutase [Desulfuromonas thiophila]|uniref:phosphopentomutase n=1 Tax=Desulfuromonas thiophila TaxID=57664 RepID=UPI0029F5A126|nr:phosphopentomutase [Desulfuromonas thiophila]
MFRRVVLIVLDGVGCGALPDAAAYGDAADGGAANTLGHVADAVGGLALPCLQRLGLGNILPLRGVAPVARPQASWGRMAERSAGKDSTTGHWEMAGVIQTQPFVTYPQGFPPEILALFEREAGCPALGNVAASGTSILGRLGAEHLRSGRPIVYTSTDSVFQIAAHEQIWPLERLYALCRRLRPQLDRYRIGRIIARPFVGSVAEGFRRTEGRHDYSMAPPPMLLDALQQADVPVLAVGKIFDLFCGRGISAHWPTAGNADGMARTAAVFATMERGLLFTNLIDFDMLYGHRNDVAGFAAALQAFDQFLEGFLPSLTADDLLLVTADHGCDPTWPGTDHCREYVPLLVCGGAGQPAVALGDRASFADIGATLAANFGVTALAGDSFLTALASPGPQMRQRA